MSTTSERAYQLLRKLILSGHYPSGARLKEEAIAAELALSRTPVRDAIRRLGAAGLVELTPNSGARVWSWTEGELAEITQMRAMLESYAAELAAAKIAQAEIEELSTLSERIDAAISAAPSPDLETITNANLAFHAVVVRAAGNSRLAGMIQSLHSTPLVMRKFALFDQERLERSSNHHREIIAALRAGDGAWAAAIMRTHILAAKAYDELLSSHQSESGKRRGQPAMSVVN